MGLGVYPLTVHRRSDRFSLFDDLVSALERNHVGMEDGDVLAVSSKYVAYSQGRRVVLGRVRTYPGGRLLAGRYRMPVSLAELIDRESDAVMGGMAGFVMCAIGDMLAPNAGIDRSNAEPGTAVLYPDRPYQTAEEIRRKIFLKYHVSSGVIITDSRLMPARTGTVGVAVACAGIEPVNDMRARTDLDGRPLKVTVRAVADGLAAAANHGMGEGAESTPYALIRGSGARMTARRVMPGEVAVARSQCVYMRSLQSSFK